MISLRLNRFPFQGGITLQSSGVGNSPTVTQATLSTVVPPSIFSSSTSLQNGNTLATGELYRSIRILISMLLSMSSRQIKSNIKRVIISKA